MLHGEISQGCLIEPFYLWHRPHLSGFTEQRNKRAFFPRRNKRQGGIGYTENTQLLCAYCIIQRCKKKNFMRALHQDCREKKHAP